MSPEIEPAEEATIVEEINPPSDDGSASEDGGWTHRRLKSQVNKERNPDIFFFRGQILDELDDYFLCIRRMKRVDPDAYEMFSRIGANVVCDGSRAYKDELTASWRRGDRPGFGALALGVGLAPDKKALYAKFAYFSKHARKLAHVEASNGTVYEMTAYWDDVKNKHLKKSGFTGTYHFDVDGDAKVRLLKELTPKSYRIYRKRRQKNDQHFSLRRLEWSLPRPPNKDMTLVEIFCMLAGFYEQSSSGARVAVSKDDLEAAFYIDIKRTPYFFSDREMELNDKGSRKRIFHIVRAHKRVLAGGQEKYVKFHFRGVRDFVWKGYQVHITMPGLHHNNLVEIEAPTAYFEPEEKIPKGLLSTMEAGKRIRGVLHR